MKLISEQIRLAATDLSNHLACRHVTTLDLQVVRGEKRAPDWADPNGTVLRERGERHEAAYLTHLREEKKLAVTNLGEIKDEKKLVEETRRLMEQGAEVIAQGALAGGKWFGRPDVLRRVAKRGTKWDWSYEVADTKLARETKAATILQISLYSELLTTIQGCEPEWMWVIPPGEDFEGEAYRVAEYAAYFRYVQGRLARAVAQNGDGSATYPEPVPHCDVCRWFRECDEQRLGDDHLSLVAGIRRQHQEQLVTWDTETMAKLAVLPIPLKERPKHGSREAIERVREQARVQVTGRTEQRLVHELLLPVAEGMGLCRLPEPSADDVFVDLEGDPFVGEAGLQYLFGFAFKNADGEFNYEKRWALNREEEKKGFEWLVDEIMRRREANPRMHVYHFGAYEPGTLKRLMGMYATREDEIDRMLRAGVLVDLHQAFKQSTLAGVEEYSLKKIEAFYGFARKTPLDESRAAMRYVEHRLELERNLADMPDEIRKAMEGYNSEDCFSAAALRDWLEVERRKLAEDGISVPRFADRDEEASEDTDEQRTRVAELVEQLTKGVPADPGERTEEQQGHWLLAQLLDWHRRDAKPKAWRYFSLREMDDADLMEEKDALAGLEWVGSVRFGDGLVADRYSFPKQETDIRADSKKEVHHKDRRIGTVVAIDAVERTIDIKKTTEAVGFHPTSIFVKEPYRKAKAQQDSLYRLGCWVRDNGISAPGPWRGVRNFLLRKPPELLDSQSLQISDVEDFADELTRIISALNSSVLAVQGPPGSGKTTNAAQTIEALVTKRKMQVGVTALSHSVIRHLLKTIVEKTSSIRCMHKSDGKEDDSIEGILVTTKNEVALRGLQQRSVDVLGGTCFLWAREEFANSVDVLFVDEASQISLADLLAISQAAKNIVLIGDPQQLARPGEASHPPGAELSSLEHILTDSEFGRLRTMPPSLGLFIDETKRLHPEICSFTSEAFYEGRLHARAFTQSRVLQGHPWLKDAGLYFVPVGHEGNRNSSVEEVEVVVRIVEGLLKPGVEWFRGAGNKGPLNRRKDILIVAPYNAQVSDLCARLPDLPIGTVDKFQGKEAAVVIYSLTTSSPEDAPRGMEFLYSLNRLNVATSRAMSNVIVVGSPKLFEPDCRSPRQMQLANALCRYLERAKIVETGQL
jgi:predicted RecB family nuclease